MSGKTIKIVPGAQQLTGDEDLSLPNGKLLLCFEITKQLRQCIKGNNQILLTIRQIQAFISCY